MVNRHPQAIDSISANNWHNPPLKNKIFNNPDSIVVWIMWLKHQMPIRIKKQKKASTENNQIHNIVY